MLRHTVLFSRSRATFAISSHSAANRRNRSDLSIGRPPCSSRYLSNPMQLSLNGSGPALHKCYAPHCTLWTNHPALPPSKYCVTLPTHPAPLAAHRHMMRWIGADNQVASPRLCCGARVSCWPGTVAPPMRWGGGYWGKTGHAHQRRRRQFVTHNVSSPPSFAALRKAYSITSSARPRSEIGMVRPSVFADLRLMISSTLADCWTGRSAGFSPLSMRPT